MKTKEEISALGKENESMNEKLTEDELQKVAGGQNSGDMGSQDVCKVMINYITQKDEFHAVYMYLSKGYLLSASDNASVRYLFEQIFGYEIEKSPHYDR